MNLGNGNSPLTKEKNDRSSYCGANRSSFISGLKFISMNINSIKGAKLELLAFLEFHQPHVVGIQETKIDSSIATSSRKLALIIYTGKIEVGSCCSFIRTFSICLFLGLGSSVGCATAWHADVAGSILGLGNILGKLILTLSDRFKFR